ncbi:MAG: Eco57I restriction-modification methylase domain-containing protein [Promethearchaeia archaeon]
MKAEKKVKYYLKLERFISSFELEIDKNRRNKGEKSGDVYTPNELIHQIIENLFRTIYSDLDEETFKFLCGNKERIEYSQKERLLRFLNNLKILDPACGSGRWLVAIAKTLYKTYLRLSSAFNSSKLDLKRRIVTQNIHGNDIEESACTISKLNLLLWIYQDKKDKLKLDFLPKKINFEQVERVIELNQGEEFAFNIINQDFLLSKNGLDYFSSQKFHLILGNPPYIENKSIPMNYKKKLYEKFHSAYKLFDLSILFIEKSLDLLHSGGYITFLITNKFLSSDYGIKLRNLLLKTVKIREIIDVSHIGVFKKAAAYPIILNLQKPNLNNDSGTEITIKKTKSLKEFRNKDFEETTYLQEIINQFPSHVIPTSKYIPIVSEVYRKYEAIDKVFDDLNIIYRPFGFTKWKKHFKKITEGKSNDKDLLLIGTGNLEPYTIKYEKKIRIAGYNIPISYINLHETFPEKFELLSQEKLVFREIAKNLTFIYDPGIFANITGLYFLRIPSLDSSDLFGLLTIFNSKLLNLIFNTLFGSLHMSGGYIRYNGSFIKRMPIPRALPGTLSHIGKINQFLSQILYDLKHSDTKDLKSAIKIKFLNSQIKFFRDLSDAFVLLHYFPRYRRNYPELVEIFDKKNNFPYFKFKYIIPRYDIPAHNTYTSSELLTLIERIKKQYKKFTRNKDLNKEIKDILTLYEFR